MSACRAAGQAERNVALAREEVQRLKGQLTALERSRSSAASQSGGDSHAHGIDRHACLACRFDKSLHVRLLAALRMMLPDLLSGTWCFVCSIVMLCGACRQGTVPWQPTGVRRQSLSSGGLGSATMQVKAAQDCFAQFTSCQITNVIKTGSCKGTRG